jgi:hypothetical protein
VHPPAKIGGVGKVWVLDTETKGTGAQMVPLEKTLRQPAAEPVRRRARPLPTRTPRRRDPEPAPPRRFRVIDALSREVVANQAGLAETIALLGDVRQPVDVSVYVWEPKADDWRLLTRRELSMLWDRRPAA